MPTGRRSASSASAPTKANVAEGEFAGVELTFMGLNNQNLHNFLFRGFLKPWEAYTGAKINWIDLAQADYNARLQQSIATGTVDFDVIEMGAPVRGRHRRPRPARRDARVGRRRRSRPTTSWATCSRRSAPGTARPTASTSTATRHTFAYRKDYFGDGSISGLADVPTHWEDINAMTVALKGKTDPLTGTPAYGFLDPLKYQWGGFGFYFLEDRAAAYAKHPDDPAWLFDPDTMKPRVNNPAWVQAIQDVLDLVKADAYPPDQLNADPNATAFAQFLGGTGAALTWWGDVGSNARTSDTSVVGDVVGFSINPGAKRVYNPRRRRLGREGELRSQPRLSRLGRLRHEPRLRRREEAQGRLVGRSPSRRQGHLALDVRLSVGLPALPQLALPVRRVGSGGLRPRLRRGLSRLQPRQLQPPERRRSSRASPASSSTTRSPRTSW